jgi:rubrerythrin
MAELDAGSLESAAEDPVHPTHRTASLEILWLCLACGETWLRDAPQPQTCPRCGAPREEFVLLLED